MCYPLRAEHGFLPDFGALEALVTERTRGLVLNTPSNPLGTVWPADVVCRAVEFAERHDIWLLSDECYDALTFDAEHVSPARFANGSNVLSVFSFSKTYAMTGLRVGYLAAPAEVAAAAAKLQEPMIACVNAPAQAAALAALRGPQDAVTRMRDTYRERRDAATGVLDQLGIDYVLPGGAFYLWVDLRSRLGSRTVSEWALKLLRDKKVPIAPGTVFGPSGEGWARLSLATDTENLIEGIQRIGAAR